MNSAAAASGGGAAATTTKTSIAKTVEVDEKSSHRDGGAKSRSSWNRSDSDGSILVFDNNSRSNGASNIGVPTAAIATTQTTVVSTKEGVLKRVRRALEESLRKQALALRKQPGSLIAFGVAGLWGLTSDIDKLGKNASAHVGWNHRVRDFTEDFMAAPLGIIMAARNPEAFGYLKNPKTFSILFGMGLCELYTMFAYLYSLEYLFTSYAVAAKRSGILLSVLGGAIFFSEPIRGSFAVYFCDHHWHDVHHSC